MAKTTFTVVETVRIEYVIRYDEEKLEALGMTLEEYVNNMDIKKNPWNLMNYGTVITDIEHNQIVDYIETDLPTVALED